jgi:SAM-dependent methyltransferase
LRRLRVLPAARSLRDHWRAVRCWRRNALYRRKAALDGLPLPPAHLILVVTGTAELQWYMEGGRRAADSLRGALERNGHPISGRRATLDFGCGCGRVVRHWHSLPGEILGCDYNHRLVAWCRRNLKFARFETNDFAPPLPYPPRRFDLVYAFSVFTHLPAALQRPWMEELARVIEPGGHLALSVHGDRYLPELLPEERQIFLGGQLVVREENSAGTNACGAYHPRTYVRESLLVGLFDVVDFVPEGAAGNPYQDLYLVRRR